jgi:uncharacterized protein with ParB-like and HNH nuclease domain
VKIESKIESIDRSIEQLLAMGYFKIPRFQRPYSWERIEVEEFWADTIVDAESDYFIGSIVLFKYQEGVFGVVDGQQRLTTITMFLCALRNLMRDFGFQDLAQGLHGLIERPDKNNKNQYVLQTETSYPFLQEHIQNFGTLDININAGEEEARLKDSFDYLKDGLQQAANGIQNDTTVNDDKKRENLSRKLIELREKILQLKIIVITLNNEDDAYVIFETLNTRGRDLTISDLVRTHITRLIPQRNANVDRAKERFNKVVEAFEASNEEVSVNTFLHHLWLSKYEYTTEKKLYKKLKKAVKTKDQANDFLASFEQDAKIYQLIHQPSSKKWRIEEQGVRDALEALAMFRVRQQLPFVLSVLREYFNKNLNLKQTKRALCAVEKFHFIFTAVTSQRSSGGISSMYAYHARQMRAAASQADRIGEIDALIEKLLAKIPPYEEFEINFSSIGASEKFTKRKALVTYILGRMNQVIGGLTLDMSKMTIEHLANQGKASALTDVQLAEIGNLILVNESLNGKLGEKVFSEKIKLLKNSSGVWLDENLKTQKSLGEKEIRNRSNFLAKLAFEKVWKI